MPSPAILDLAPAPTAAAAARVPELLAPAGNWECARAAVENGADAIYFGLSRFNARMRADNFTESDLPALMEVFAPARGARVRDVQHARLPRRTRRRRGLPARGHRRRGGRGHRAGRGHLPVDPAAVARFPDPRVHANDCDQRGGGGVRARARLPTRGAGARMFHHGKSPRSARRSTAAARRCPWKCSCTGRCAWRIRANA